MSCCAHTDLRYILNAQDIVKYIGPTIMVHDIHLERSYCAKSSAILCFLTEYLTPHFIKQLAHTTQCLNASLHRRRLLAGSPGTCPPIIEKCPCIYHFLPYFSPNILVCSPNVFDKSTPVLH